MAIDSLLLERFEEHVHTPEWYHEFIERGPHVNSKLVADAEIVSNGQAKMQNHQFNLND